MYESGGGGGGEGAYKWSGVGGLGREHLVCCVFLLLFYFCFVFVSYRLETKF